MPTPTTIAELQTDLESNLSLGHQFIHGGPNEVVVTEAGDVPTISNIARQLLAGAVAPSTPLIVAMTDANPLSSNLNDYVSTSFTSVQIIGSDDATWDEYNQCVSLKRPGMYKVTIVSRVTSTDSTGGDSIWPSNLAVTMTASIGFGGEQPVPSMRSSAHNRVIVDGSIEPCNFEQWTDEFMHYHNGSFGSENIAPSLGCKSYEPSLVDERHARFDMLVSVVRVSGHLAWI